MFQVKNKSLQSFASAKLAIILGSGLECTLPFVKQTSLKYSEINDFPQTHVQGHKGVITFGELENGFGVLCFAGRFHLYEGWSVEEVQTIVNLVHQFGIPNLLITNAAGGISEELQVTDLMVINKIKDYQNDGQLTDPNGLIGCLTKQPLEVSTGLSQFLLSQNNLKSGTYAAVLGPNYETLAEINLFKQQGCSAVGMSTYLEIKKALELGINVAAISSITNSWSSSSQPTHAEVLENSKATQQKLNQVFASVINKLNSKN